VTKVQCGNEPQWFPKEELPALQDFFRIYELHFNEIEEALRPRILQHPTLGPILMAMTQAEQDAQSVQSRQILAQAIESGDFSLYAQRSRIQGAFYATLGVRFSDWYYVSSLFGRKLLPLLAVAYGVDPQRLIRAISAMQTLLDQSMTRIGEAYIETKEAALRKSEQTLSAMLSALQEGVVMADADGKIWYRNPAAQQLTKSTATHLRETQGIYFADGKTLMPQEQIPLFRALRGEIVRECEIFLRSDKVPAGVHLSVNTAPILDHHGVSLGAVASFRDISYRSQLEEQRARATEFELQSHRMQVASRLKSEFLANMSHELRTPLNSIIGFAQLLHAGQVSPDAPEHHEFLGDILNSGQHLLQLINDVLDLSKVEAGKMAFHAEPVEPAEILTEVISILRTPAAAKRIFIETSVEPTLPRVVIDPSRLKQVLYNYLSNALKFTPDGGRIKVRVRADGEDHFRVEVEDTGIGIHESQLARLFIEFQQLDASSAKKHGGTGLGLALTKRLVEAQGGSVGVSSTPGRGSLFHARLPRLYETTAARPTPQRKGPPSDAPRILVIEDDARDREEIVRLIHEAGYAVDTAATGAAALSLFCETAYDAITLDLLLPDMSGVDVLRAIRSEPHNQNAPVIVVTVVSEPGAVAGCAVVDVLAKPLDHSLLLRALERLPVAGRPQGPILVVDDDLSSLRLIEATLHPLGHRTVCYTDAKSALTAERESPPVAVVLDLLMPGMNGFEFLERFRSLPENRAIPVIIWTVKDLSKEEHERLRASAHAVVQKGRGGAALVQELRTFLPADPRAKEG
jgi:PAS domain S-box-containing protein